METNNFSVGNYITVGQNIYRIKDNKGNSDLICIAVTEAIAQLIADKFNGTPIVPLGSIPNEQLHSNK
jgi:hypothetical protein